MATENGRGRPFCTLDCTSDGLNTIIPRYHEALCLSQKKYKE
jgi:hypothetical protein